LTTTVGDLEVKKRDKFGVATGTIPVTVRVDPERYKQFDQAMRPILERVAKERKGYTFEPSNLAETLPGWPNHEGFAVPGGIPLYSNLHEDIIKLHYGVNCWDAEKSAEKFQELGTFGVMLFDHAEPNLRRMRWTVYELDQRLLPIFTSSPTETIQVQVRLLDERKKEIAASTRSGRFPSQRELSTNPEPGYLLGIGKSIEQRNLLTTNINLVIPEAFRGNYLGERSGKLAIFAIGPFFSYNFHWNAGGFSPELRFAMPVTLPTDDVEKVKSTECQLSFKKGETIFSAK